MQCGCPECGTLMGQDVKGASSRCVCPNCGYACDACLGTASVMEKGHYVMPESFAKQLEEQEARRRKAMDAAGWYLGLGDKTASQMEKYLKKRGFEADDISATLQKLNGYGYVDDRDYARRFVEQEVGGKKLGRRAVEARLYKKGIDRETAREFLDQVDPETECENALLWAKKLSEKLEEPDARKKRDKLARRLIGKGFSYESINRALNALEDDSGEQWDE